MRKIWVIILGTPHRLREPGKQSPDGRLKECVYGREIVCELKPKLEAYGLKVFTDYEPLDLPKDMQTANVARERERELRMRVDVVNQLCREYGKENCLYVSLHCNGSPPNDGKWHQPNGWQVNVGTKAGSQSKLLAGCLAEAAKDNGLYVRKPQKSQPYWPQNLYVLNQTACPAVLTENLFQDNLDDVDFLLSDEGRHVIERLHVEGILKYIERK